MIDVDFTNQKLRKLFDMPTYNNLKKKIGLELTKPVKLRIQQIKASSSFYKYIETRLGRPERLSGVDDDKYSVVLTGNYRLIVKPITEGYDKESLLNCDRVIIEGVVDYHGDKYNWIIP